MDLRVIGYSFLILKKHKFVKIDVTLEYFC